TSRGVRAGANTPPQLAKSYGVMPDSIAVGTLGKLGFRCGVVTASARSAPDLMCGAEAASGSIMYVMRLEIRSGCAAELPLYCTSVIAGSDMVCAKSSVASCCGLPG